MDNLGSVRTQMSFMVSVLLHGAVVAFLALGPLFLSSKSDTDSRPNDTTVAIDSTPVDISVESAQKSEPQKPAEVPAPVVKPEPVPAPIAVAKDTPKIVAVKKPTAKKIIKVQAKAEPQELPQKIEPQEVLAAENTETPLEKTAAAPAEEKAANSDDVVVAKNEETVAPVPAAEEDEDDVAPKANDSEFASEKPATTPATTPVVEDDAPKAVEQAPLPPPVIKQQQPPSATTGTSPVPAQAAGAAKGAVVVTQDYQGLKQMSGNLPPSYSREMRMAQMQGAGQLVYYVNKDGSVSQMKLTKSTGYAELDQAAIDAFSKYKFVPGQDGFTVHNFEFSLKGPAVSDSGRLRTSMK